MPDTFYEEERGVRGPNVVALAAPNPRVKLKDLGDGTFAKSVTASHVRSTRINTATTTVVKNTPGDFFGILIGQTIASGVVEVFNALTATGAPVLRIANAATLRADQVNMALPSPIVMSVGITVRTTGVQDVTVLWS